MSASLVGSEMCIRDRSRSRPRPRPSDGAVKLCASLPRGRQVRGGCPVSYTHLTLPTICSV
eukprot:4932791-Alexandrium_andersonii.AAC.1